MTLADDRIIIYNDWQLDNYCPFVDGKCRKDCNFFEGSRASSHAPDIHADAAYCKLEKKA